VVIGCFVGTVVGVLPGIGPTGTMALLLPLTFALGPTGGMIMLAGIVVNNAIVLMDYIDLIRARRRKELGLGDKRLPYREIIESIIKGGALRLRPVLLTATTTVLGLIPLAVGFNFNFITFLQRWDPEFYMGGDNVVFWGPMSWTIIFGLTFATFLTLVIVPVDDCAVLPLFCATVPKGSFTATLSSIDIGRCSVP